MSDERIVVGRKDPLLAGLLDELIEQDYPGLAEQATLEKIAELRAAHVARYRRNLDAHYRYVNVEETERLLGVWLRVEGKPFSELDDEAKLEVLDALVAEAS